MLHLSSADFAGWGWRERFEVACALVVVGLCAGGHIREGHAQRLRDAGAHHVVDNYPAIAALLDA